MHTVIATGQYLIGKETLKACATCNPPFAFTYWNMSPPLAYSMEMARYSGVKNTCISKSCCSAYCSTRWLCCLQTAARLAEWLNA